MAVAVVLASATAAPAAVDPYQTNDYKGFRNVLPAGENGHANAADIAAFFASGGTQRPPHNDDQLKMYGDLVYASPGLAAGDLGKWFKDASFGVKPGDVERQYSPRADVTIVRDKGFGVPHIYGDTRAGAMFGAGYVGAEDRLFFMDVLRHLGRGQLSSFAGGSEGNRKLDREQWSIAPYTEEDLQRQVDLGDVIYGAEGQQLEDDVHDYVAGINAYITEARLNPAKMPGEYGAINRPQGPSDWKVTDVVATASLVGGIFGKGGGGELDSAQILQAAQERFGADAGRQVWSDFRSAEDPEAPTTVEGRAFPYEEPPSSPAAGSLAMPDAGSVQNTDPASSGGGSSSASTVGESFLSGMLTIPKSMSNALLVSGAESKSGRPLAVFGPQTGYFSPQILMEIDLHAPAVDGRPGLDARGAAFPGVNLYVELGRGRDFAWSATSAGQDIIDTFALELCEPDASPPSLDSDHYVFRGECKPIEVLERTNTWTPNAADQTPPGSETIKAERTDLGLVTARATIDGKPVIYTKLRSTYKHETDSARGFADFNDPAKIQSASDFQRAAYKIGYTFNWFYTDNRDIAYFNSGDNPVRADGVDPNFPVHGSSGDFIWKDYNPDFGTSAYTPFEQHPQVVNQGFLTSWNNKQAPEYRASDDRFNWTSLDRVMPLNDRIREGIKGAKKMTLPQLVDAMEDAGTVDLRGDKVLPWALKVLGKQKDPALADAVSKLTAWQREGAHRRDRDRNGVYEHTDAIRIMDAWWPLWVEAEFKGGLGDDLYDKLKAHQQLDNAPNNHGDHLGSAYDDGWYGYAERDLRTILGRPVSGAYSRRYCGDGDLARCRTVLEQSLSQALQANPAQLYDDKLCRDQNKPGDQWCYDAVYQRPLGAITQPLIHWINRPTFQQAVEVEGHR